MENLQEEIWKEIPEYEGLYEVSNWGRVRSFRRKGAKGGIMVAHKNNHGYYAIKLYKNNKQFNISVHQLVAISFLGHKPCGYEFVINHIDGNKTNNHLSNLEIVTQRENCTQRHKVWKKQLSSNCMGVYYSTSRDDDKNRWCSMIDINLERVYLGHYKEESEAALIYQVALKNIDKYNGDMNAFRILVRREAGLPEFMRTSKYKGVFFNRNRKVWGVVIGNNPDYFTIGFYKNEETAVAVSIISYDNLHLYNGNKGEFRALIKELYQKEKGE